MVTQSNGDMLHLLGTLNQVGTLADLPDGVLLERFLARTGSASELAFEVLVRRHGPMVLSRCRGVLRDEHAVADAFQATFLVLARRGLTIRGRGDLGPWLGRVAARVARRARVDDARRIQRERRSAEQGSKQPLSGVDLGEQEVATLIREEVDRLPRVDRLLVRLTYWRGKTYEEAAARLSLPVGTVRSRLSRLRDRLRGRLVRRGVAPVVAVTSSTALVADASAAQPQDSLVLQTVRAAACSSDGIEKAVRAGAVSATVAALATGELAMLSVVSGKSIAVLVILGGLGTAGVVSQSRSGSEGGTARDQKAPSNAGPAAAKAPNIDRDAWARMLAALSDANWRTAFAVGEELASLPPDEGFAILKANWTKVGKVESRQQLLKAWSFANHARLVDGLDLGMRDPSPEVQSWAISYLNDLAFQDFSQNFRAYKDWYQATRGKTLSEVIVASARQFAAESARSLDADAANRARWLARHVKSIQRREVSKAMQDAGFSKTLEKWASGATSQSPRQEIERVADALNILGQLKLGEAELRRVVVPLLAHENPAQVRSAAVSALEGSENAWATELLLDVLKRSAAEDGANGMLIIWGAAGALASYDDPRVIPTMIAVIDADNTYNTVYGIGHFGLGRLTGVQYDESHNGAWWREWWENNNERYPEAVRAIQIPRLSKRPQRAADVPVQPDPLADIADIPALDLRAEGDDKKRYFLIGPKGARPPAAGFGLLVVLPGGDGSAEFQPFVRRIHKNVLNDRWLIAQAVAPKWDAKQFDKVVWPTATSRYPSAKFTTEEFIDAMIRDVRSKAKIDPRRVFLLGWSSGGPPCYAMALRQGTPVTGAFIAMSVFSPQGLPSLERARGKPFFLLQSPQDPVTPIRHALAAESKLQDAGARVRLKKYDGGHGWRGDVWANIGEGITWLEQQTEGE